MKTLSELTETNNLLVNTLVGLTLSIIALTLITLTVSCVLDTSLIANASF